MDSLEKSVEKIIKTVLPQHSEYYDWDENITIDVYFEGDYINALSVLVNKEKDKLILEQVGADYLRKHIFYDAHYAFGDTLNKLKEVSVNLIKILNE